MVVSSLLSWPSFIKRHFSLPIIVLPLTIFVVFILANIFVYLRFFEVIESKYKELHSLVEPLEKEIK